MNSNLAQLINLAQLDSNIDAYAPKIAEAKSKSEDLVNLIENLKAKNESCDESIKEQSAAKVRIDNLISELGEKLKSIKAKSATVTKEKEIQALNVEEDITTEQLNKANADIERTEKIIESLKEQKQANEAEIKRIDEELKEVDAKLVDVLKSLESERAAVYEKKEELAKQIDTKLLSFYEKIRKWAKNTAVVPVRKQACFGCFMKLNNKSFMALTQGSEINTCPHCGRIIYIEESKS